MTRKHLKIVAQNCATSAIKHLQNNGNISAENSKRKTERENAMTEEKQLSDKLKELLTKAYNEMLSESISRGKLFAKKKKLEVKANTEQLLNTNSKEYVNKGENKSIGKLKCEMDSLFDISYSQTHSKLVRLGKIQAKRERLACYYAHGEMSEDDYKKHIADLDILENEIKGTPPLKSNLNAIILCRVTSSKQTLGYSLLAQEETLNTYCKDKGMNIIGIHKIVEGVNGNRPAFNAILDYIENFDGTIALVCDKVERLLRKKEDYYRVEKLRKTGKLELHFVRNELVLSAESNSNDLLHYGLILGFAQQLAG